MSTGAKHYRYYDPLIDLAFWSFLLQSIIPWLRMAGVTNFQLEGAWGVASAIAFYGTWLLTQFLILATFMRDEYAQGLWQRAGARIVKLLTVALPVIFITTASLQDQIKNWLRGQAPDSLPSQLGTPEELVIIAYATGMLQVVFWTALYLPFLFICLYKWQRWRDA